MNPCEFQCSPTKYQIYFNFPILAQTEYLTREKTWSCTENVTCGIYTKFSVVSNQELAGLLVYRITIPCEDWCSGYSSFHPGLLQLFWHAVPTLIQHVDQLVEYLLGSELPLKETCNKNACIAFKDCVDYSMSVTQYISISSLTTCIIPLLLNLIVRCYQRPYNILRYNDRWQN